LLLPVETASFAFCVIFRNILGDRVAKTMTQSLPAHSPEWRTMVANVFSDATSSQLEGTAYFQRVLSAEASPPIQQAIDANLVPRFVAFLQSPLLELQLEAARVLTDIAGGLSHQTRAVVDAGAVPALVPLLRSPHDSVREQAFWVLANIAADSPRHRDMVLSVDAVSLLLENFAGMSRESLDRQRQVVWTLSNFCRGKPQPAFALFERALPVLAELIYSDDAEVLVSTCWALSQLTDGSSDQIEVVINTGVLPARG
jgi:importin subunit alpha-1